MIFFANVRLITGITLLPPICFHVFFRDSFRFTRRGTYKVKKGKKEDDKDKENNNKENNANKVNIPEIKISRDGRLKPQT